jgi:hypothetical protein
MAANDTFGFVDSVQAAAKVNDSVSGQLSGALADRESAALGLRTLTCCSKLMLKMPLLTWAKGFDQGLAA